MFANLTGWHMLIILAVILLLFGAARLPAMSRSVGQSVRILREETRALKEAKEQVAVLSVADERRAEPAAVGETVARAGGDAPPAPEGGRAV